MGSERAADLRGTFQVDTRHIVHGPALSGLDVIRCFGFDVLEPRPVRRRKIPGGTVKIVFAMEGTFAGQAMDPAALVIGLHDRAGTAEHFGRMRSVQVQLEPWAARRLLGVPLDEIRNTAVDLGEFFGNSARRFTERLAETASWSGRFELVGEYLRNRSAHAETDSAIVSAARQLQRSGGTTPLTDLAVESGWSRRHLRRRFTEQVGLPPKVYGSLMRFSGAFVALTTSPAVEIGTLASNFGYYDQSHLYRDFQRYAGATPGHLLGLANSSGADS
ncbi:helix-turn-helix domain-containing protein [Nocardia sp. CA-129566]|uniref:helix-turn-helix domain-containing protein n=1 Tax=Nocardia sp. CA-129566 TaxID=3239976 RepID=UPI003D97EA09